MNSLKLIKITVFFFSFLLFLGVILCLNIIHQKHTSKKDFLEDINLSEPEGSEIKNIVAVEKDLYIMVKNGGLSDRILVFSPEKHRVMYTIKVD